MKELLQIISLIIILLALLFTLLPWLSQYVADKANKAAKYYDMVLILILTSIIFWIFALTA